MNPEDVVGALFEAIAEGRPDSVIALVDADVEWTPTPWSGSSATGHERVREWMLQFGEDLADLRVDVAELEGNGPRVLVLGTVFDRRNDQSFATRVGWIFEVEGELITRARAFSSWPEARAAAGGSRLRSSG